MGLSSPGCAAATEVGGVLEFVELARLDEQILSFAKTLALLARDPWCFTTAGRT